MPYDLVIKNGIIVDPAQGLNDVKDVAFSNGKVAALDTEIPEDSAYEVLDANGLIVTPGLIDLHVHAFWGASDWGIEPDPSNVAQGVTTAVDAGSAGANNFPAFRKYVLAQCITRLYALLNVSTIGLPSHTVGELEGKRWVDTQRTVRTALANSEYILGIKARLGRAQAGDDDLVILQHTIEVAETIGKFVMIHVGNTRTPLEKLLAMLRPGDVVTHSFHNMQHGILDQAGTLLESIREAQHRGVIFDVGHGVGSFTFEVADKALSQGFYPNTISSDLHFFSIQGAVPSLINVLNKLLYLGMSLTDVIRLSTQTPAGVLSKGDELGTLKTGATADATIMCSEEGRFSLTDTAGISVQTNRRLAHRYTVCRGHVFRPWLGALQAVEQAHQISWQEMLQNR